MPSGFVGWSLEATVSEAPGSLAVVASSPLTMASMRSLARAAAASAEMFPRAVTSLTMSAMNSERSIFEKSSFANSSIVKPRASGLMGLPKSRPSCGRPCSLRMRARRELKQTCFSAVSTQPSPVTFFSQVVPT